MKRRFDQTDLSEEDELQATGQLRRQVEQLSVKPAKLPESYLANLLVRTNARIDDASSAKAISISWAARVAIPGVVAILFFFVGLHYYAPDLPAREGSVMALVGSLPQDVVDSLLDHPERVSASLTVADVPSDVFQFSGDQITEYLAAHGNEQLLMESMDDAEVSSLLTVLGADKNL